MLVTIWLVRSICHYHDIVSERSVLAMLKISAGMRVSEFEESSTR